MKKEKVSKELRHLKVGDLVHADWNPRSAEELSAEHDDMKKLVASVRELGVVQPIAVWDSPDGRQIVIAGNRRFEAARFCDVKEIPAMVFTGISLAQAQEITRVENEVRLGVNPISDAGLINSMLKLGYDQKEIASHFGVSEATVCRRAKLLDLIPEIREIGKSGKVSTNALEQMALFPADVQRKCLNAVSSGVKRNDSLSDSSNVHLRWADVAWSFNQCTRDLAEAPFDCTQCMSCVNRTGAMPDLWGCAPRDGLGRCLDAKCWSKMLDKSVERRLHALVGDVVETVSVKDLESIDVMFWHIRDGVGAFDNLFSDEKNDRLGTAYWHYHDYSDKFEIVWGLPFSEFKRIVEIEREKEEEKAKRDAEEEQKRQEEEAAHEELMKKRRPLLDKVNEEYRKAFQAIEESNRWLVLEFVKSLFKKSEISHDLATAFLIGIGEWELQTKCPSLGLELLREHKRLREICGASDEDIDDALLAIRMLREFDEANDVCDVS